MSDDGFGPVQRSGSRGSRRADAPVRPLETTPSRAPKADDGFGPPMGGSGGRGAAGRGAPGGRAQGGRGGGGRPAAPAPAPAAPQRRKRGVGRILIRAIIMVVVFALLASLGLLAYASLRMDRVRVSGLGLAGPQMNVLVVGTDSREGLSPEELQALGTEAVDGKRTDTIFLLSARGQRTAMLSFPRDLFVTRCDGTPGRINAAFTIGDGPTCLTQTVERLSGISVTHYMEMNFVGFRDIVDGIGSVPVVLDAPLRDVAAGVDLPAGCSRLSGDEALGFVRARSVDSDLGRIERQQYFLQQVAREAASPSTVLNPVSLIQTTGAVGGALTVNATFGPISLLRLGFAGRGLATGSGLPSFTVPASPATIGGAAVLVPDDAAAEQVFSSFRDGTVFDDPPPVGELGEAAGARLGAPDPATLQLAALGLPRLLADAGGAGDEGDSSGAGGTPATC